MWQLAIIDDEPLVISGIQAMLKRINLDIIPCGSASNGIDGYDLLLETKPDIIITDIYMPQMDGISMIESVIEYLPNSVFVVISGYQDFEYARQAISLGVIDYIDKPITLPKLQRILERCAILLNKKTTTSVFDDQYRELINHIAEAIIEKNPESIIVYKEEMIRILSQIHTISELKNHVYKISSILASILFNERSSNTYEYFYPSYTELSKLEEEKDIIDYLDKVFEKVITLLHESTPDYEEPIHLMKKYIQLHFREDISLTEIADELKMNPTYLSILFKKKAGISFIRYLTEKRIEEAKKLLASGLKVNTVSQAVGYNSYRYFCDVFKKITGHTPGEYRDSKIE